MLEISRLVEERMALSKQGQHGIAMRHPCSGSCIQESQLLLADGTKLPIVKSGGSVMENRVANNMPVAKAMIGTNVVNTLRDNGCSGVVVRKKFVKDNQYTGECRYILLIDNTVRRVPVVKI